jgi:chromosomal replication initiator protein
MEQMNLDDLWQKTLGEMEVKLSRAGFATWVKDSRLVDQKDGTFYIALPNNFTKTWWEDKYHKNVLGILRNFDASARKVEFVVRVEAPKAGPAKVTAQELEQYQNRLDFTSHIDPDTNLNSRYTLESFVVGPSNEMAYAAANAVVAELGTKYNPFFVYGGVGLGKTHLIQGIGNAIKASRSGKVRVRYVASEKFTTDVVWAIRNKRMEDMKKKYRDCDVLIIDDIQFISGKEKTMEEFFHSFNALYEQNKQIIISSDRPPQSMPLLEDRLRSRFEGGLIADVSYPEFEMRLAIVNEKLREYGHDMEPGVADLIARRVKKNIRELEGVVKNIVFHEESKKIRLSVAEVDDIVKKSIKNFSESVSDDQIIKAVGEFFNVAPEELVRRNRKKEVVEPRQIAMYLMRDILEMSYPYIGEKMGRDHTTAIHAVEKIGQEINKNSSLNQKINLIRDLIYKN